MDDETLAMLGAEILIPDTDPPSDPPDPVDQAEQKTETPDPQEIPEGYTRDARTGEIRPKKTRGRPRKGTASPRPETPLNRTPDETPDSKAKGRVPKPTTKWQKGVIATGMTKLYKRTGRIVKQMDKTIGIAIIDAAEDCGEAWDELARTNPRVRAFLLKLCTGGAWGAVIMAHLPIFMAVLMKDRIREHLPFTSLMKIFASDDADDDTEEDDNPFADMFGGMTEEDMQGMMQMASQLLPGMVAKRVVPGTVVRGETA